MSLILAPHLVCFILLLSYQVSVLSLNTKLSIDHLIDMSKTGLAFSTAVEKYLAFYKRILNWKKILFCQASANAVPDHSV